jgi:telomerase Cajal body protein 1
MSHSALKVRCLASTRASDWTVDEAQKEQESQGREDAEKPDVEQEYAQSEYESDGTDRDGLSSASSTATPSSPGSTRQSRDASPQYLQEQHTSCIHEAQISPDGSCVFTSDYSRTFLVYPIDFNLHAETGPSTSKPYASFHSPNPIWAFAANPLFNLQDASSTNVLVSRRDSYITLHNALWDINRMSDAEQQQSSGSEPIDIHSPLASYKLINHLTEAVTAPISLTYSHDGAHFFAGTQNGIATFDLEHTDDPIHTIQTIPSKRNKLKGGGRGFKGWISALSLSPPTTTSTSGLLAAGARTRYIGIYDPVSGTDVTHFSLPGTIDGKKMRNENLKHVMGEGVSHLKWSPCSKYLYVAERDSDVLLIYDVRNFSLSVAYCTGRKALTKQKLGFDVWNAGASPYDVEGVSHEIWAGGTDGKIRVWRDPYVKEGAVEPDEVVKVHDGDVPVVSTLVHASGNLAVAASGVVNTDEHVRHEGKQRGGGVRWLCGIPQGRKVGTNSFQVYIIPPSLTTLSYSLLPSNLKSWS